MINPELFEEIFQHFSTMIPPDLYQFRKELKENLHATFIHLLDKLELVTRDEFEAQMRVLLRTREKLEELEKKIAIMEKDL